MVVVIKTIQLRGDFVFRKDLIESDGQNPQTRPRNAGFLRIPEISGAIPPEERCGRRADLFRQRSGGEGIMDSIFGSAQINLKIRCKNGSDIPFQRRRRDARRDQDGGVPFLAPPLGYEIKRGFR